MARSKDIQSSQCSWDSNCEGRNILYPTHAHAHAHAHAHVPGMWLVGVEFMEGTQQVQFPISLFKHVDPAQFPCRADECLLHACRVDMCVMDGSCEQGHHSCHHRRRHTCATQGTTASMQCRSSHTRTICDYVRFDTPIALGQLLNNSHM